MAPILHPLTIHTRRPARVHNSLPPLIPPLHIHVFEIESVNVAWEIAEESEKDVDEEVCGAAG
jgi:hypothetical protein